MALVMVALSAVGRGLSILILAAQGRQFAAGQIAGAVGSTAVFGLAIGTGVGLTMRNLGWVRTSEAGLEFASTGFAPMFLPWSAVQSVHRSGFGPFTRLIITPTDPTAVSVLPGPGRMQPDRRRRGFPSYMVDVGLMDPGSAELFAELDRRMS